MLKSLAPSDALKLLLVLALAAAMRLFSITDEPLWLDEAYSWWDAQQSLRDIWWLVPQCDPHPPLYVVLLKGWVAIFGDRILALRALSTFFSVLATLFVFLAGSLVDRRIGWIAGLLFAIAPFQIEFGQEARPYTLVALGAAILVYGLLRLFHSRDVCSPGGWVALIAGATILLWSNNTSVFTIAAAGLAVLGLLWRDRESRGALRPLLWAGVLIVILWLPYLPSYYMQAKGISSDFWIPRPDLWRVFNELRFVHAFGSFRALDFLLPLWALGLYCLWRDGRKRAAWILLAMYLFPVLLNLSVSLMVKPIYLARALIGIAPAYCIVLAAVFAALKRPSLRHAAVSAYVLACVLAAGQNLYWKTNRKEPWDDIATAVVQQAEGDTVVFVVPNEMALPLNHALAQQGRQMKILGLPEDFPATGLNLRYPSGKCSPALAQESNLDHALRFALGKRTLLFLTRRDNVYDPHDRVRQVLAEAGFQPQGQRLFLPGNIEVHRYGVPKSLPAPIK